MSDKRITIGLFGFGCVGQGLYDVLNHSQVLEATISKICVKDRSKPRKLPLEIFTFDKEEILKRDNLDVVVELIDDADEAFRIVRTALSNGVNVVTANKKMLAEHFEELYHLALENNAALLYEGSVGGSIPIIRNLEEYYDNELLDSVSGIVNGSSNYILTRMELEGLGYEEAVRMAQQQGFAESDPWLDVGGYDSKYKLLLLTVHAFGTVLQPNQILNLGIQNASFDDIRFAQQRNSRIKLVARAHKQGDKVRAYVLPHFVERGRTLYNIMEEYNAIEVEGAYSDRQTLAGKGAGSYPTGSAVLSDISALTYGYRYEHKKLRKALQNGTHNPAIQLDTDFDIKVYVRFNDRSDLDRITLIDIEEEYRSPSFNYVVGTVRFSSLFNLFGDKEQRLFVCAMG
jgi:homoserine dehydrogenase